MEVLKLKQQADNNIDAVNKVLEKANVKDKDAKIREIAEAYKKGKATPVSGVPRGPAAAAVGRQ